MIGGRTACSLIPLDTLVENMKGHDKFHFSRCGIARGSTAVASVNGARSAANAAGHAISQIVLIEGNGEDS